MTTAARAKNKTERIHTSNRKGIMNYDRQEYVKRLEVAGKEIGILNNGLL